MDTSVAPGIAYEYKVVVTFQGGSPLPAYGYLVAGYDLPAAIHRGRILVVVDASFSYALAPEITRFKDDLLGDGWQVESLTVSPQDTPQAIQAQIRQVSAQNAAGELKAAVLIGRVPFVLSGDYEPDGHPETGGPWPSDIFYADMDGTWSDSTVNRPGINVPSDGKLDPSSIRLVGNGAAEIAIGRIDLRGMSAWPESETALLKRYFDRNHAFRTRSGAFANNVPRRGILKDYSLGYFEGEAFASVGWRAFSAAFGKDAWVATETPFFSGHRIQWLPDGLRKRWRLTHQHVQRALHRLSRQTQPRCLLSAFWQLLL